MRQASAHKKRILVIYASSVISPLAQPHGAVIIAEALMMTGFEVKLACPFWRPKSDISITEDIKNFNPDMIAISIRNHGTAGFDYRQTAEKSFFSEIEKIISLCVSVCDVPVILGGSGFSVDPYRYIDISGVTAGFIGNSESDFVKFADKLLSANVDVKQATTGIQSIVLPRRINNSIPSSGIKLGSYNFELCPEGVKAALAVGGTIPFRTKSGCNGKCIYCVMPVIEGKNFRSPQDVVAEISKAVEYKLGNRLFCADSEFGQDSVHDKAICWAIIKSGLGKKISINGYGDPFYMDTDMTNLMRLAGWKEISLSVDSFSQQMRKMYGKRGSVAEVKDGVNNLLGSGIKVTLNVLIGGPSETFDTIDETLATLKEFKDSVDICFTFGLTVFPNTPLFRIANKKAYSKFFKKENGDFLSSFCSPCPPSEIVDFLQSRGIFASKDKKVIFWNEEPSQNDVDFNRQIIQIANGNIKTIPRTDRGLQQVMLEVANLISKGGE